MSASRPGLRETLRLIRADYRALAAFHNKERSAGTLVNFALHPCFWAVALHRTAHYFERRGRKLTARLVYIVNTILTNSDISPNAEFGEGLVLLHPSGTIVSGKFGKNVVLTAHVGVGGNGSNKDIGAGPGLPVIGDGVVLGARCLVMGPHVIGDGAFVCATSLVLRDVPAGARVAGNPARVVSAVGERSHRSWGLEAAEARGQ
ncbi:MAG: hypothetical protein HY078_08995 [Elusimicrobia bacterium]|nr:hypothetical protein [Elusimicrobiota bacterium]